ncbi:ABC transporter permease [Billgrantia antri]|uniref:Transport permease protein n=1 Tax=Halomonas sulfidivorans TaxID=2733488 RepID=A0ABX7WE79_9GAMM|nr:ABC transporter permease [Halomonas sulfidivorans]QTP58459.1 ABC transporter permease [Halomonas sulfidivorans]
MNPKRIAAVATKEAKEVLRDPITVGVALIMPLVMLLLFGYAITLDVDDIPMGVLDQDRTPTSRQLSEAFTASETFRLERELSDPQAMERALQHGEIRLALVIPPGFERALARHEPSPVQLQVDGTYSATATLVGGHALAITGSFGHAAPSSALHLETRVWYNPSLSSVHTVVPGLYAVILMAFPPLLTALALVREKETGTIAQIYASPLSSVEFLAGKLMPYAIIAFVQMAMVIGVGFLWFGVPFRGSVAFLLTISLLYVLCTLGIGLLVSAVTRTQLVALLAVLIVTLMPSLLFSGMLFPIFTMPYVVQLYTLAFPGRYFVDISRGVVLKGVGLEVLWPSIAIVAVYTLLVFALAVWRLKKKVA